MKFSLIVILVLMFAVVEARACDNCNAADTVRSNIIRAMKARSATQVEADAESNQPSKSDTSQLDENFFSDQPPQPNPGRNYRRPRVIADQY